MAHTHSFCRCDRRSPPERILRSPAFNHALASRLVQLDLSGDATVDLVLSELLDHRFGKLFGPNGGEFPLDHDEPGAVAWFDSLFSEDQRRFINRYKVRAGSDRFAYRLQSRLAETVALMFLALEVRDCRLSGRCANAALPRRLDTGRLEISG